MNYINTHIRTKTPSYRKNGHPGWDDSKDHDAFYTEAETLLRTIGFTRQGAWSDAQYGAALTVERGKESLYLHPDDFSGWLAPGSLDQILEVLKQAQTCKVRFVDTYETKVDCTVEAFEARLTEEAPLLRERLIERMKVPNKRYAHNRKNIDILTKDLINPMDEVGDYRSKDQLKATFKEAKNRVIQPLIEQLIQEGLVCRTVDPGNLVEFLRTRGKTELAEWKREAQKQEKAHRFDHDADDRKDPASPSNSLSPSSTRPQTSGLDLAP